MKRLVVDETHKTISITAYLKDFNGDTAKWREAYFKMLSWKNTWWLVYQIDLLESTVNGVYIWLVLHEARDADRTISMMNEFGYQNIQTEEVTVGEYELNCDYDYAFEM